MFGKSKALWASLIILFCVTVVGSSLVWAKPLPPQAAIATQHPLATQAGRDMIAQGGNAFDAAVAISAMLAVVEPYHSGLGGGGFWLLHEDKASKSKQDVVIDGREMAPQLAHEKMYLSETDRVRHDLSTKGALSSAIPGTPAALAYISKHYGKLPLSTCLAPAIKVAKEGFTVDKAYQEAIMARKNLILENPEMTNLFMKGGKMPAIGARITQPELAKTLSLLAKKGHNGFYKGITAEKLVAGVKKAGGIWSKTDLSHYKVKVRKPLYGDYHGVKITTVGPPSAGGVTLLTALNILAQFEMDPLSEADKNHLIIESLRRAFCDRATYLGDPDYVKIPLEKLIGKSHARTWRETIDLNQKTPSTRLSCGVPSGRGQETSHFSIIDTEGNRVAATLSINHYFGSGVMPEGTGVILNNEMDDFAIAPGVKNTFGLVGHKANLIQPKKRPLSSMTPVFIENEWGVGVLGTPGGSRIPSMLLLAVLEAQKDTLPKHWVKTKRFHHQYLPDVISFEPNALESSMQNALRFRGHRLEPVGRPYGNLQAVFWHKQQERLYAASDPRGGGEAVVF